jgi:hypothetical protein
VSEKRHATDADLVGAVPGTPPAVAPELNAVDVNTRQFWLDETQLWVSLRAWGRRSSLAHALWAAHMISLAEGIGTAGVGLGPVSSMGLGPGSVSFSTPASLSAAEQTLSSTKYGRILIELRRTVLVRAGIHVLGVG